MQCLFGTQAYNGDYHFTSFTDLILRVYLEQTGFEVIALVSKDEWLFDCSAKKIKDISLDLNSQLLQIRDLGEFIRIAYNKLLEREPDIDGYIYYKKNLESQNLNREQFLEAIYSSQEYSTKKNGTNYNYQPVEKLCEYSKAVARLEEENTYKVVRGNIDNTSSDAVSKILQSATEVGMEINNYTLDISDYESYFEEAEYILRYPNYYVGNIKEKSLEHYISINLLNINENDVFIDIASEHSPVPEIYSRLKGCRTYSQDIMYPDGVIDNRIGGDACAMPLPSEFASKASLTCSIEHFEGDADTKLFRELFRVLKVGGKVVVVPFYLFTEEATQTDPTVSVPVQVAFDEGCTIYCAEGWGNRHGRFYSPASFIRRIVLPMKGKFNFEFFYLQNAVKVDSSIYARFAFVGTKL